MCVRAAIGDWLTGLRSEKRNHPRCEARRAPWRIHFFLITWEINFCKRLSSGVVAQQSARVCVCVRVCVRAREPVRLSEAAPLAAGGATCGPAEVLLLLLAVREEEQQTI